MTEQVSIKNERDCGLRSHYEEMIICLDKKKGIERNYTANHQLQV